MRAGDTSPGLRVVFCLLPVTYSALLASADGGETKRPEFFKPPSPCLTGPSCKNCVETIKFFHLQVCCYHCRLDNLVITNDVCHCIDTRLPDSATDVGGNCSSGRYCDNCAVTISSDSTEGLLPTPGRVHFCCQDCGLVMPYLHQDDEAGCHCVGETQGRVHQAAPRYDPTDDPTLTTPPNSAAGLAAASSPRRFLPYLPLASPLVIVQILPGLYGGNTVT